MICNFSIFISLCFISKIYFHEIYQYVLISMVILVNVISMEIISIFTYILKKYQYLIEYHSTVGATRKVNFAFNTYSYKRHEIWFYIRVIKCCGYRIKSTNLFRKMKTRFLLCVKIGCRQLLTITVCFDSIMSDNW